MKKVFGIIEICIGIVYAITTLLFLFVFDVELGLYFCCAGGFVSFLTLYILFGIVDIREFRKNKEHRK